MMRIRRSSWKPWEASGSWTDISRNLEILNTFRLCGDVDLVQLLLVLKSKEAIEQHSTTRKHVDLCLPFDTRVAYRSKFVKFGEYRR
jgi:hypothetical protein